MVPPSISSDSSSSRSRTLGNPACVSARRSDGSSSAPPVLGGTTDRPDLVPNFRNKVSSDKWSACPWVMST